MKKLWVLLVAVLSLPAFSNIQQQAITGTVTSAEDGSALPGVTVALKGTVNATYTDANGKYTIQIPSTPATLVFSFIGLITQEVVVSNQNTIDVSMKMDTRQLNEVVITGYATQQRSNITGSATTVKKGKRLKNANQVISPQQSFQPQEEHEEYSGFEENTFHDPLKDPLSTFSIDVDAASYSNVRRFIENGQKPPKDAVRIEEMINYFDYQYPEPSGDDPLAIYTEVSQAPWNNDHLLVHIGIQGKSIPQDDLPPSNLVFLIDVSGSMSSDNKLPLVKQGFRMLVDRLREQDRVSIVVYAGAAGVVLEPTSGHNKKEILNAIDNLTAGGSTAGGEGIRAAYDLAKKHYLKNGNNRVILATDGDFNVGESSNTSLETLIENKRNDGIFLSVLGFGIGNYKDSKMEILADKGNGNYAYIDNLSEARKVFINEFGGTLFTLAKDCKIQIEFNPRLVQAYRLIGYENRALKSEDFNNDKKDAGELGSGHSVTALYEIIPPGVKSKTFSIDKLKYQSNAVSVDAASTNELMTVKVRYKAPLADESKLIVHPISNQKSETPSDNYKWSAAVAAFGMLLRESEFVAGYSYNQVVKLAQTARGDDPEGYRAEFIRMAKSFHLIARK